jgi:hypothetical protein
MHNNLATTDEPRTGGDTKSARRAAGALAVVIVALAVYANLSFCVNDPADYRYFPPFREKHNANMNRNLGSEYYNIARSLAGGQGYSNPFPESTGPTAWMPPALPYLMAGVLWACAGERDCLMTIMLVLQTCVLVGTGWLVLELARRTTRRVGPWTTASVYLAALLCHFHLCFQTTNDIWIVMLAIDLLCAGLCWCRPLQRQSRAVAWGFFGGLCALVSPIAGFTWAVCTLFLGVRQRAWPSLTVAALSAALALAPWVIRNYFIFGRFVPVKSNLAYELYQSQCLQSDGLLQRGTFSLHPYSGSSRARREYREVGEIAFVEQKGALFRQAVWGDPTDFLERLASRFLGVLIWYEPLDREYAAKRPCVLVISRVTHPIPFLGLLTVLFASMRGRLEPMQGLAAGVFVVYCLPYILISYYERYTVPLLGLKVLLVVWAVDRLCGWRWPRRPRHRPAAMVCELA